MTQPKKNIIYSFAKKISDTAKEEYWLNIVLWVLWTSLPVTFIGSYILYGDLLSSKTFLKFAAYTIITCFSTVLIQIIKKAFFLPKEKESYLRIVDVNNALFQMYFDVRNEYIKSFPDNQKKDIAAWWVLRNPTSTPNMIKKSILDLTNDEKLATSIENIEILRKQGIKSMIDIENKKIKKELNAAYENLKKKYPGIADLMKDKFLGNSPSFAKGKKRPFGFIEKAIQAEENNDLDHLNSEDVMSIIVLAMELLSNRKILLLKPKYQGNKDFKDSKEKLESLLLEFRIYNHARNRLAKTLIKKINFIINKQRKISLLGISTQELNRMLDTAMEKYYSLKTPKKINNIKILYKKIETINKKATNTFSKIVKIQCNYNKLWSQSSHKIRWTIKEDKSSKIPSVTIKEHFIQLDHKKGVHDFAIKIEELLEDLKTNESNRLSKNTATEETDISKIHVYKKFAIELINIIDDKLNISEPERQLAIETSKEINISMIDIDATTRNKKYEWSKRLVEEIEHTKTNAIHNIASYLVKYFNIHLEEKIVNHLVEEYSANRNFLMSLMKENSKDE